MSELSVYEEQKDLVIARPPQVVLEEAKTAAKALKDVIAQKAKPFVLNGEQYLEFEDWQTLGKFYGVTVKVVSTAFIDFGTARGFEAKAVAVRPDGMEISAAEAMCLNDEANWKNKPLFQLRSMAQTRACAKALRNVLAWVVVLAGYKPTPAEEMTGGEGKQPPKPPQSKSQAQGTPTPKDPGKPISEGQKKLIYAKAKAKGLDEEDVKKAFNVEHLTDLTMGQVNEVLEWIDNPGPRDEERDAFDGLPKD